ncbi:MULTISPECIES: hypothetical protein [unclassified Pseudomonas]|uniref:hypothetical protein n=1 Tax=unclassified Pseudomonas TaxID=196821 RepID=UPI000CD20B37|nr:MULTISPECIES: hypothetical protein [unclassified Pseudomonas]POA28585.1 hypothetical protein C1887_23115 [Pseudomonas sp. GW456-R21]POA63025.1 hypothetical protein C1884_25525 [Pseudomonas sp. GW460-R15]
MKTCSLTSFGYSVVCLALLALSGQANAALSEFSGRGVYHFASNSGCAAAATSSIDRNCNRIALDVADAHASVDPQSHAIVIGAAASHDSKTVIGDVLLHGSGIAADGQRVPLSLHVLLRRSGKVWKSDTYVHSPVRGKFGDIVLDPYQISVREGASERLLFTAEQARDVLAQPSIAARVASYFVVVRPSDAHNPAADDITIALGVGRVSKSLMRASFTSEQLGSAELDQLPEKGTWSLNLQALSSQIPVWVVQRQLFVFGLEDSPLLKDVRQRGLNKRDTLELGAVNGKGYLRYNGREESFPAAYASGSAFMRDSFIGMILAWRHSPQATTASAATDTALQPAQ